MNERAVCVIDLDALAANLSALRRALAPGVRICAVVKADAYGHGAAICARTLAANGVDWLATASLEEARVVRSTGVATPLLVLGGIEPSRGAVEEACQLDVVPALLDAGETAALATVVPAGRRLRVHLKIDTGMSRAGLTPAEARDLVPLLRDGPFELHGIYSHLACADAPDPASWRQQLADFEVARADLAAAGVRPALRHLANSAGLLADRALHLDMVRPGLALYGHRPLPGLGAAIHLAPVMEFATWISQIRTVPAGTGVGYGWTWRAERPTRVATLPVGYAQGYTRSLSNRGEVALRGQRAPVVGNVSMEHTTIDVTDIPEARAGDRVLLWGAGPEAPDVMTLGCAAGTIGYELLTGVAPSVRRVPRGRPDETPDSVMSKGTKERGEVSSDGSR